MSFAGILARTQMVDNKVRLAKPELLDALQANDPRAMRSRSDLRIINFLMGNESWIINRLKKEHKFTNKRIVEIGAGDGDLCRKIHQQFPEANIRAYDLLERPAQLPEKVEWCSGDVTQCSPPQGYGALIANLFIHHFDDSKLAWLSAWLPHFSLVIINEPLRRKAPHLLGALMHPFINDVTRHDMHVSIDAGFRRGEIMQLVGISSQQWSCEEIEHWKGACRTILCKR